MSESRTEIRAKELVTYWDPCNKNGGVHILKSSEVLKRYKVSIVDCLSGRFSPRFFYCETGWFHWFS